MIIKYFLVAYHSRRDANGNVYWALSMSDMDTHKEVHGIVSGGESDIYGIKHGFTYLDEWDSSILFDVKELPVRKFNKLVKEWQYAGCTHDQLTKFVKTGLGIMEDEVKS